MVKTIQISAISGSERIPPVLFALRDDGSVWVYKPEVYISHGHERTTINSGGWDKIPDIPE